MADLALLERLCCARGISGCEEEIREIILEEIRPYADCVEVTPLGNLLAFKKGANRAKTKLMLNAHMDEVGMTVTYIEDNGLLRFATVGGIDRRVLCGKPVTVGDMQINCTSLMYGELPVSAVLDGDTNEPTEG